MQRFIRKTVFFGDIDRAVIFLFGLKLEIFVSGNKEMLFQLYTKQLRRNRKQSLVFHLGE